MYDNTPTEHNRNGARPTYLLLAVDGAGLDWWWRTTDDAVLVIDETEIVERLTLANHAPEDLVARIASERGMTRKCLAGSMAEALSLEVA